MNTKGEVNRILIAKATSALVERVSREQNCPKVLAALFSLGWSRKWLAQFLCLEPASVTGWSTGKAKMPGHHKETLFGLLNQSLARLEERIEYLKLTDELPGPVEQQLKLTMSEAKRVLREYRIERLRRGRRQGKAVA